MNIDEKITSLKAVFDAQTEAVGGLYDDRKQLQAELNKLQSKIDNISEPFADQARVLEEEIKSEVLEFGKKYEHPLANVTYRKAYTRTTYDDKKLDMYALTHPEVTDFKKVTEVSATTSIKWI